MTLYLTYLRSRWSTHGIWHRTCYIWEEEVYGNVCDIYLLYLRTRWSRKGIWHCTCYIWGGRWSRQGIWHCTCYIWEVDGLGWHCTCYIQVMGPQGIWHSTCYNREVYLYKTLYLLYLRSRWSRQGIWYCTCYIWEVDGLGKVYDIVLVIFEK